MDYYTDQLEEEFSKLSWDEVYSFVEFTLNSLNSYQVENLEYRLNKVLQEEGAQYKIFSNQVVSLMSKPEVDEIESAQDTGDSASVHINKAIELFNKRPDPDYANSIKESISAVEALAREVTGNKSAVLSDAVKLLGLHPALKQGITKLYAWTSDEGGIRHSLKASSPSTAGEAEARFALVVCSAITNLLK